MTTDQAATNTPEDAIEILKGDHQIIREQFREIARLGLVAPLTTRIALVQDVCIRLTIHAAIEEELFYPAARNAIHDEELMNKAEVEHATARYIIEQLLPVELDDEYFDAKVHVLREYTKHHIDEEESVIFPKVKQSHLDLRLLGRQLQDRKLALQAELVTTKQLIVFVSSWRLPAEYGRGTGMTAH